MDLGSAGLREQPFRASGKPISFVEYAALRAALDTFRDMLDCRHGLTLLQGPPLSGKTTLLHRFAASIKDECAVAIIDGRGLNTATLLSTILRQYGYDIDSSTTSERLAMLRVFCMHQAASGCAPLLVVENIHEMNPSAMRALAEIADIRARHHHAMRMILSSNRSMQAIVDAEVFAPVKKRISGNVHLRPMNAAETRHYLHSKLRAAGAANPDGIVPMHLCDELWQASGGWPGILDRITLLAMARAKELPISISNIERPSLPYGTWDERSDAALTEAPATSLEPARITLSLNGQLLSESTLDNERALIGRSEHNDITIDNRFVSRHHALLVRHGTTTFLMDLNSTNGTLVNSRRVSNHILMHGDVISIGHHRLKFHDPAARSIDSHESLNDTAIMRSLQDMRRLLARENTALMPVPGDSEDLPTYVPRS